MRKKCLLTLLIASLLLWPAGALAQTWGIANQIPILYISDAQGPADELMDDNTATVWYGQIDAYSDAPTWTVLLSSKTVREIWIRNGARQDPGSYLSTGRASLLAVTVYYGNQQSVTYRYALDDSYISDDDRNFVDGYQRLLLPQPLPGVFCVELKVMRSVPGRVSTQVAMTDILLSSGQPSKPAPGVQMRPSAPTMRPFLPVITQPMATASPTWVLAPTTIVTPQPTMVPVPTVIVTNPPTQPPLPTAIVTEPPTMVPVPTVIVTNPPTQPPIPEAPVPEPPTQEPIPETIVPESPTEAPIPSGPATMPPTSMDPVGITATLVERIATRTGPGTRFDEVGSFFQAGATVQVLSKVWDPVNTLYWYYLDFTKGDTHYRGYAVHTRVDLDPSLVPDEPEGVRATIVQRTENYFGPGADYKAHTDRISAGTSGYIYAWENGCVLFEWHDRYQDLDRRAWIPESNVAWEEQ